MNGLTVWRSSKKTLEDALNISASQSHSKKSLTTDVDENREKSLKSTRVSTVTYTDTNGLLRVVAVLMHLT